MSYLKIKGLVKKFMNNTKTNYKIQSKKDNFLKIGYNPVLNKEIVI